MKHIYYPELEELDSLALGLQGSARMTLKVMSEDSVCIQIAPGGCTPDHSHEDKERSVVISGKGEVKLGEARRAINPGDFLEFEAGEQHQILNNSNENLMFLCFRNQK